MLKECALAFARTKPTEWDHFRQEWFTVREKTDQKIDEICFRSPLHSDISNTVKAEELVEENILGEVKPKAEPVINPEPKIRRRNLNRDEIE